MRSPSKDRQDARNVPSLIECGRKEVVVITMDKKKKRLKFYQIFKSQVIMSFPGSPDTREVIPTHQLFPPSLQGVEWEKKKTEQRNRTTKSYRIISDIGISIIGLDLLYLNKSYNPIIRRNCNF